MNEDRVIRMGALCPHRLHDLSQGQEVIRGVGLAVVRPSLVVELGDFDGGAGFGGGSQLANDEAWKSWKSVTKSLSRFLFDLRGDTTWFESEWRHRPKNSWRHGSKAHFLKMGTRFETKFPWRHGSNETNQVVFTVELIT